jgi:hypothetical protein
MINDARLKVTETYKVTHGWIGLMLGLFFFDSQLRAGFQCLLVRIEAGKQ